MAQIKEELSKDILDTIKSKRDEVSNLVLEIGQITLRSRELKNEISKLDQVKESIENRFDEVNNEMSNILAELEVRYPKGEIDLNEGVIYYEPQD